MVNDFKSSYTSDEIEEIESKITNSSYENLIQNLKEDLQDFVKIFSVLSIFEVKTQQDFDILIFHLTNHANPVREVVSLKLEELACRHEQYYLTEKNIQKLCDGLIDINPNVSRAICSIIENNSLIREKIEQKIIEKIEENISLIKNFEQEKNESFNNKLRNTKSHAKNKILFSLYWLLEGLSLCVSTKYYEKITNILNYTLTFSEYTIREKTAKILAKMDKCPAELLQIAKSDQNFYVKNLVYGKITT